MKTSLLLPVFLAFAVSLTLTGCPGSGKNDPAADPATAQVTRGAQTPSDGVVGRAAQAVSMLQFVVTAGDKEDVIFNSMVFHASGTANDLTGLASAAVYRDVDGNGEFTSGTDTLLAFNLHYGADNGTMTANGLNNTVSAGTSARYILVYYLSGAAASSQTFTVSVNGPEDAVLDGAVSGSAAVVSLVQFQGRTITTDVQGALTVTLGPSNPGSADVTPAATLGVLQVRLAADTVENILVNSAAFTAAGTGNDLGDVSSVSLYADDGSTPGALDGTDTLLGSPSSYSQDNGTVAFSGLSRTVTGGSHQDWLLVYSISGGSPGVTFTVSINPPAQIAGTGTVTGYPAIVLGSTVNSAVFTVRYGTLSAALGTNTPAASNVTPPSSGKAVLQVTMTAGAFENVSVTQMVFQASGSGNDAADISGVKLYDDGGTVKGQYDAGDTLLGTSSYPTDDGQAAFTIAATVPAAGTLDVLLVYDFTAGSPGSTYQASINPSTGITAAGAHSGRTLTPAGSQIASSAITVVSSGAMNWTRLNPSGSPAPGGLRGHSACYDPNNGNILIFGGSSAAGTTPNGGTFNCDVWELSVSSVGGETWNLVSVSNPPPASIWHSAVFDSANGYMYVYGGIDSSLNDLPQNAGDIWMYDANGRDWKVITTQGSPPKPKCLHAAAWDPNSSHMVIYGGINYSGSNYFNDAFILDFTQSPPNWSQVTLSGSEPSSEGMAGGFDCVVSKRMVLFGGFDGIQNQWDSNTYDLDPFTPQWQILNPSTVPNAMHRMAFDTDSSNGMLYMFGGLDNRTCFNDAWVFDFNTNDWTRISTGGSAPSVRCEAAGAWDAGNSRFIVYGGWDAFSTTAPTTFTDCHELR